MPCRPWQVDLTKPCSRLRAEPARGIESDSEPAVEREGGDHKAGLLRGVAVVTRTEALGHGYWLDATFLAQTHAAINASEHGVKARFTHPGLSSDGLGLFLGRFKNARIDGDVVRADLHFSEMARETPDGDLVDYVMGLAEADPQAFGTSIVYMPDLGAEDRFIAENEDAQGEFHSPDPDNVHHLPHARLHELRACDVVDDPAANPSGLFGHGQEIAAEAESLLSYAFGLCDERPNLVTLEIDADRAAAFVRRFLDRHDLTLLKKEPDMTKSDDQNKKRARGLLAGLMSLLGLSAHELSEEETPELLDEAEQEVPEPQPDAAGEGESAPEEQPTAPEHEANAADRVREQVRRYTEAFGEAGLAYWRDGKTFEEAALAHARALEEQLAAAEQKLAAVDRGEDEPAEFADAVAGAGKQPTGQYHGRLAALVEHNAQSLARRRRR